MPNKNGTGPAGMGPMTGRGAGFCGRGSQRSGQSSNSDWLVSLVGTAVLALGSIVFRALTRKLKSKAAETKNEEKISKPEDGDATNARPTKNFEIT